MISQEKMLTILQHISLDIKDFFSIQGIPFIRIFLLQGIAFPTNLFQVYFKTFCAKKRKITCHKEKSQRKILDTYSIRYMYSLS